MPKPFTINQIFHAWLETQIGSSRSMRPKGCEVPGEGTAAWPDTCQRAMQLVESFPMYDLVKPRLIEWFQGGLAHQDDLELCLMFQDQIIDHLRSHPFYPTTARQLNDDAKTKTAWLTADEAAHKLNLKKSALHMRLNRRPEALPFGTYKFERKWFIHPLDLSVLMQMDRPKVKKCQTNI